MIEVILSAIIMVGIMMGFSFFIFKNVIKRINQSAKRYFIEKLQEYNYLIEEKEEELQELREIAEKQKILQKNIIDNNKSSGNNEIEDIFTTELEEKLKKMRKFKIETEKKEYEQMTYNIPNPQYREESFFKNYKELRKKFKIDNEKIIKDFIVKSEENKQDERKFKILTNFRKQFKENVIYECLTLSGEEQYSLIQEVLKKEDNEIIQFEKNFRNKSKFNVTKLISFLEKKKKKYDPTIYVYVGQEELNYNYLGERVKTRY